MKCDKCSYEYDSGMSCPLCAGMGNYFWMENVRNIAVDVDELIEEKLKSFGLTLTDEQEDNIHNAVWKVLEGISNGYYKNHN